MSEELFPSAALPGPVLIVGAPRSGTSWLGKIFDSHPRVIYRHEPDDVLRQTEFPVHCPVEDIPRYLDSAARYVKVLTTVRTVKTAGTRPVFTKPFQSFLAPAIRQTLLFTARAAETIPASRNWGRRLTIPDFARENIDIVYVIKSVSLLGATRLLANALPNSRIIAVFRHPCGQIASLKRSRSVRTMEGGVFGFAARQAQEFGLTKGSFQKLSEIERFAWGWALLHAKLVREIKGLRNVHLLRYEDLCEDPPAKMRELLTFSQLGWTDEVASFITSSTRSSGRESYYSIFREPVAAATKWKNELPAAEIERILSIVNRVVPELS